MTMKTIELVTHDDLRYLALIVPDNFDTQRWANTRADALRLLKVKRVIETPRLTKG